MILFHTVTFFFFTDLQITKYLLDLLSGIIIFLLQEHPIEP